MSDAIFSQNRELLYNILNEHQEIGIAIGEPHAMDHIAAGLALYLSLASIGKNAQVISGQDVIVEFAHLVGADKIKKEFSGSIKMFTISLPYQDGEIEKVSYKIENDKLNINLFVGEKKLSFSENEIQYIKKGSAPTLVFTIGIDDTQKLFPLFEPTPDIKLINIDNKAQNSTFGDIVYVDTSFSSLSEIVAKIIKDIALFIDGDIAQNLLDGISHATDNFVLESTSPHAFESAAYLLKFGAKRRSLKEQARKTPTLEKTFLNDQAGYERNSEPVAGSAGNVPEDWFSPKVFRSSAKKQD